MMRFAGRRQSAVGSGVSRTASELPDSAVDPENAGCTFVLPRVLALLLARSASAATRRSSTWTKLSLITGGLPSPRTTLAVPLSGSITCASSTRSAVWDDLEARFGQRYAVVLAFGQQLFFHQGTEVDPRWRSAITSTSCATSPSGGDEELPSP